jgi:hypothetical protein
MRVKRVDTFVSFLVLEEMVSVFFTFSIMMATGLSYIVLLCWGTFLLF